ncbi:hypothetical protein [Streptomyces sp. NPDC005784]|uniref:hypothetical protein n=1 Tax=Streptomyces sp. NPDC005784 TaxID=3364731 RepID=UPI0036858653
MAREALQAELAEVGEGFWRTSRCDGRSIDWLPLVSISESGLWLGVDRQAEWILGRLQGKVVSSAHGLSLPQPWLTLLDMSESDFQDKLGSAATEYGLTAEDLCALLPIDDVLSMGLRSQSGHWAECATRWLVGRVLREDHVELLREVSNSRWANQWTRQSASRLVSAAQR